MLPFPRTFLIRRADAIKIKRELRNIAEAAQRVKDYEREDTIHLYT